MTNANNTTTLNTLRAEIEAANTNYLSMLDQIGHVDGQYTDGIEDITRVYIEDILEACVDYYSRENSEYPEMYLNDFFEAEIGTNTHPKLVNPENLIAYLTK